MSGRDVAWLAGQGMVFVVVFVVLPLLDGGPGPIDLPGRRVLGAVLVAAAVVVAVVAMRQLGRQLVPQPTPVRGGELVTGGLYGVVRHPIYLAVLLACAGAVVAFLSVTGVAVLGAAVLFFDRKSAWEERQLAATYPGWDDYRTRVRSKLVPGLR